MRPLIVGNWKMNGLTAQLADVVALTASMRARPAAADALMCPLITLIERAERTADGLVYNGPQNCDHAPSGASMGEVSAEVLRDSGASGVIVGHSERRQQHDETDAMVAAKANAAGRAGLHEIICVGETKAQRASGQAGFACGAQLARNLPRQVCASACALGSEPRRTIGSGRKPEASEICEMHAHLRHYLLIELGAAGKDVRNAHGGSVTADNASASLKFSQVGGVLVGGASLNAAASSRSCARCDHDLARRHRRRPWQLCTEGRTRSVIAAMGLRRRGLRRPPPGPSNYYPDFVIPLTRAVANGTVTRGIARCGIGVGVSIAANKLAGVRAGLLHDVFTAHQEVKDDDMNLAFLGNAVIGVGLASDSVHVYLNARLSGAPRHQRRLDEIRALKKEFSNHDHRHPQPRTSLQDRRLLAGRQLPGGRPALPL